MLRLLPICLTPLALSVAFLAGHGASPAAAADPDSSGTPAQTRLEESTSVPMDMGYSKPIVSVRVNGRGPYRFFLDSAAGITVLDSAFAKELGLVPRHEVRLGDPANPTAVRAHAVTVDSLRLGDATFTHFEAVVFDRSRLYSKPDAPKGVLGFPLFRDVLLTFDYPNEFARVSRGGLQRVGAVDILPFKAMHGVPTVTIDVAGRRIEAHLDSGSPGTLVLPASLQDSIPLLGPLREVGKGRTVAGEYTFMGGELAGPFKFGTHTFDSLSVRFVPGFPRANVGSGILKNYMVTFDQRRERVRLAYVPRAKRSGAAASAEMDSVLTAARTFGVRLRPMSNGNLEVTAVDPGSPAEETGVEPADVVIGIDGHAVTAMSPRERVAAWDKESLILNVRRGERRYAYTLLRPASKP